MLMTTQPIVNDFFGDFPVTSLARAGTTEHG
jgi:hypothetical protein